MILICSCAQALGAMQREPDSAQAVQDEGILGSLERDLGEALERMHARQVSSAAAGMFLQQALSHGQQRSAWSINNQAGAAYQTAAQLSMRLRFVGPLSQAAHSSALAGVEEEKDVTEGDGSGAAVSAEEEKAAVPVEEDGLTAENLANRRAQDNDVTCFYSLDNWRAAPIGLGLLVRPR